MKTIFVILVTVLLLSACSSPASTTYFELEAQPTLTIDYQVVGSTQSTFMVVVNPKDNADRSGLSSIGLRLCDQTIKCKVWFWDDITKADTSYPVDPDREAALIAVYTSDIYAGSSDIKVFALGDER